MKAVLLLAQWPGEEAEQAHRRPRGARSAGATNIMNTLFAQANNFAEIPGNDNENRARKVVIPKALA